MIFVRMRNWETEEMVSEKVNKSENVRAVMKDGMLDCSYAYSFIRSTLGIRYPSTTTFLEHGMIPPVCQPAGTLPPLLLLMK